MQCGEHDSPALISSIRNAPYSSSLATSASASSQSVWSDTASQSSDDTSISTHSDSESCDSHCLSRHTAASADQHINFTSPWTKQPLPPHADAAPSELRQNPRRTSTGSTTRSGCPPALIRQGDRKVNFVDSLVDSSTQIVEAIWPLSPIVCRSELGSKAVLPLRTFIQETLRRHDFTMEQPDDSLSNRVLQCGRRMFLAALILASKYLQDRNYSARAWSKISGLNTQEINQNEMVFLVAVNWKLHITDEVFQRWTEIVLKFTPPSPPSPGSSCQIYVQQCLDWKQLILKLNTQLDNIEGLIPITAAVAKKLELRASSRRVIDAPSVSPCGLGFDSVDLALTPKPKSFPTPVIMEPTPATVHTPGRPAPALGLLPTPRLTPQTCGFNTPAVSAVPHLLGKGCAMGMAWAQATSSCASQFLDRMPSSTTSSPLAYFPTRRSSLANSVSTASSPESMVSDSSRTSRSSSISSASSLISAAPNKLGVPARLRYAKLCAERPSLRTTFVAPVPEDYEEMCITSSPESYTGPVGKLGDVSLETPLARRERELEEMSRDPANDAARALQEMQNYHHSAETTPTAKAGLKRSRTSSMDNSLHENVREMLSGRFHSNAEPAWPDALVRSRRVATSDSRKRVCYTPAVVEDYEASSLHPAMGSFRGPGMWEGILN